MDKEKKPPGQPTKYKPEYENMAYRLCLLGATDEFLAESFDVCVATIYNWKNDFPTFLEATKRGKARADAEVAEKLFQRATGYTHDEEKIFCSDGQIVRARTTKHYAPDTVAAIFWLKNRQPEVWRDKHEIENSGSVTIFEPYMGEKKLDDNSQTEETD